MSGERAPAHRPRDDPGEVEHPHSGEGPVRGRQRLGRRIADAFKLDWGQRGDRPALGMDAPLCWTPHHGGDESPVAGSGFEPFRLPFSQGSRHRLLRVLAFEQTEDSVAVMWENGMYAHPAAVAAPVDARNPVPGPTYLPAVDAKETLASELGGGVVHVHVDVLPAPSPKQPELRCGEGGRGDGGCGGRTHPIGRGEHRVASVYAGPPQRFGTEPRQAPDLGEGGVRPEASVILGHGRPVPVGVYRIEEGKGGCGPVVRSSHTWERGELLPGESFSGVCRFLSHLASFVFGRDDTGGRFGDGK